MQLSTNGEKATAFVQLNVQATMSSGWIGPGANSSPQNQEQLAQFNSLKAAVEREQKEKRDLVNAERASLGLPPGK